VCRLYSVREGIGYRPLDFPGTMLVNEWLSAAAIRSLQAIRSGPQK